MSWVTECPACEKITEHTEFGVVQGHQLFRCRSKKCEALWEKVVVKQIVGKKDPVRKSLVL